MLFPPPPDLSTPLPLAAASGRWQLRDHCPRPPVRHRNFYAAPWLQRNSSGCFRNWPTWATIKNPALLSIESWLVYRDPYIGRNKIPISLGGFHPLYNLNNQVFFIAHLTFRRRVGIPWDGRCMVYLLTINWYKSTIHVGKYTIVPMGS